MYRPNVTATQMTFV